MISLIFYRNALQSSRDDNFLSYNQLSFTPGLGLSHVASTATKWSHAARCAAERRVRSQQDRIEDLEDQLGIESTDHWTAESSAKLQLSWNDLITWDLVIKSK